MITKIVLATNNKDKINEMKSLLNRDDVYSLQEMGIDVDVEETGVTYHQNAQLKLDGIIDLITEENVLVIADDSGITFDCLNGMPGVYSHRYMGNVDFETRNQAIIDIATARDMFEGQYTTVLVYAITGTSIAGIVEGHLDVAIQNEINVGRNFAYDSMLKPVNYDGNENFDTMGNDVRKNYSHRANAVEKMKQNLNI